MSTVEINEVFKKFEAKDRENFKKHGYVVIRNFFEDSEIEALIKACDLKKNGDTLIIEEFKQISLSEKIIKALKTIIPNKIVYPCLSLNRSDDQPGIGGEKNERVFHVDSIPDDFDYNEDYKIYNTGIYLSDHKNYSGGLKIRPFSNKIKLVKSDTIKNRIFIFLKSILKLNMSGIFQSLKFYKSINIDSKPGDFIIWDHRCHHSGHFRRLKFLKKLSLEPFLENWLPKFIFVPEPSSRRVVLTVYADASSKYLENYIREQIKKVRRKDYYLLNKNLEEHIQYYRSKNIEIRNDGYKYWSSTS